MATANSAALPVWISGMIASDQGNPRIQPQRMTGRRPNRSDIHADNGTTAVHAAGGWLTNYAAHPWMWAAPLLGFVGPVLAAVGIARRRSALVFGGSSAATIGIIASVGASMFPFILPSSIDAHSSLTVWNASSSQMTLWIMLLVTLVFLPIVLIYTSWAFKVMFGRVTIEDVRTNPDFY